MWWETYNISWIFCDHLKSSPYHHPISTVQVELVDEKAGSVYTVSFHQMILFGFSRFCVKWSQPMYYIVWFLWISDICQTSLCFSTKVQDYDPYRSWAGSQYGRWELPTSKSKWATWVRISQIYLHWSGSKSTRELRRNSNAHLMTEKSNGSAKVLTNVFLCLLTFDRDAIVENDKLRKWPLFYCFCSPAGSPSTTPERALWAPGLPWARNTPAQDSQLPGAEFGHYWFGFGRN